MGLKIQSSVYPKPQTLKEWRAFLKEERERMWRERMRGNEDLIDIERD